MIILLPYAPLSGRRFHSDLIILTVIGLGKSGGQEIELLDADKEEYEDEAKVEPGRNSNARIGEEEVEDENE